MTKQEIPNIRFKNYTDAWEQRKLGEVAKMYQPITISQSDLIPDISGVPAFGANGYIGYYHKANHEKDQVTVSARGENTGVPSFVKGPVWITGNSMVINVEDNEKVDKYFLYSSLKSRSLKKYVTGGAQPQLTREVLNTIIKSFPSLPEQSAIGDFFRQLDTLLTLHQRKLNELKSFKSTMLSKMFPKHGQTVPEIRLAGFDGEWEKTKLRDVSERVQGNDGRMDLPTLTISAAQGWLSQKDRFSQNIAGKEQKNYTLLKRGELSYNHGNSKLAKYGVVFELNNYEEALVPRVYHSFKVNELANPRFIETMFATKQPDRELRKLVSSGARMDGLLNINYDDFMGISIIIPTVHEQETIGEFFSNLDDLISSTQSKIEELETLKKKLLQEMFV